jgi:hypothetical protein
VLIRLPKTASLASISSLESGDLTEFFPCWQASLAAAALWLSGAGQNTVNDTSKNN